MLGPDQMVIWADLPFPHNPFPAIEFTSLGLGGGNHSTFIYVPKHDVLQNVHLVKKHMSEGRKGGLSTDLIPPQRKVDQKKNTGETMKGGGAALIRDAFEHPVKVFLIRTT